LDILKKANEIKLRRLKLGEKMSKENKENENDFNNRSLLLDQ
jgi:hypothetical protein